MSSNNTKQWLEHVNYAWNMSYDSEKIKQTVVLFLSIPWALALGSDCNTSLGIPAID